MTVKKNLEDELAYSAKFEGDMFAALRAEHSQRVLEALTTIVEDDKQDYPKRLESANMARGIIQDMMLFDLSSKGLDGDSSFKKGLLRHADKLDNRKEP